MMNAAIRVGKRAVHTSVTTLALIEHVRRHPEQRIAAKAAMLSRTTGKLCAQYGLRVHVSGRIPTRPTYPWCQ